jgi:hypothetical protein
MDSRFPLGRLGLWVMFLAAVVSLASTLFVIAQAVRHPGAR